MQFGSGSGGGKRSLREGGRITSVVSFGMEGFRGIQHFPCLYVRDGVGAEVMMVNS